VIDGADFAPHVADLHFEHCVGIGDAVDDTSRSLPLQFGDGRVSADEQIDRVISALPNNAQAALSAKVTFGVCSERQTECSGVPHRVLRLVTI